MPDRSVYLVEKVTAAMIKDERYVFVDDATLGSALAEGWEISTTLKDRKLTVDGQQVIADMIILRQAAENRGVSVAEPRGVQSATSREPATSMTVTDEYGRERQVSIPQAMVEALQGLSRGLSDMGHVGHLGAPGRHNMPGMQVISGEMISKAYDMGLLAGASGQSKDANPFPAGSPPYTKWLQGFAKAPSVATQKLTQGQLDEAESLGYKLAQELGANDVVHCPHSHPALKAAWVRGFQRGGGRVE
jgi:ribosome modulation factor